MTTLRLKICLPLVAVLCSLAMQSAAEADIFSISAGGNSDWVPICCGFFTAELTPLSSPVDMHDQFGVAIGSIGADVGSLHGSLTGSFFGPALQSRRFNPGIEASHLGFLRFDGPTPTVDVRANLHLDGTLTVKAEPQSPHPMDPAGGVVSFEVTINNLISLLLASAVDDFHDGRSAGAALNDFAGLAIASVESSLGIAGTGKGRLVTVPTGVPVPTEMTMRLAFIHLTSGFAGTSTFSGRFGNTFSWATDRPVFDLPPGYTVNGMGIVDNQYVVPETINGFAALIVVLMGLRYQRKPN